MLVACCAACGSPRGLEDVHRITAEAPNTNIRPGQDRDEITLPAGIALVDEEMARLQSLRVAIRSRLSSKIQAVPDEIWATIFEAHSHLCRLKLDPANSNKGMAAHFPLMLVSRKWLEIALGTPALWSYVVLHMGAQSYECLPAEVAVENVDVRLLRSKQHPLDVIITANLWRSENITDYSGVLERLLGESRRFNSLIWDVPVDLPAVPKIQGTFNWLTAFYIRHHRDAGPRDEYFWGGLKDAPIRFLTFHHGLPPYFQFAWENIVEVHTDRVHFLLARLEEPRSQLRRVELDVFGTAESGPGDGQIMPVIENSKVRELRINSSHPQSYLLIDRLQLSALEELTVVDSDRRGWADNISPNLLTFLSHTSLQSLVLHNINFTGSSVQTLQAALRDALPLLRSLSVSDFWEDGDRTPSTDASEERGHWTEFPLYTLHHSNSAVLPALENLCYAIYPGRFFAEFQVDHGHRRHRRVVTEFLESVEDLIKNRLRNDSRNSASIKKFVLKAGGQFGDFLDLDLAEFPWFAKHMNEFGLVFEFVPQWDYKQIFYDIQ
ncbi:hypothetical protein DFH07DRAFT_358766 [Mycena maculata]|uniref:F-box domain-containing protein n=1 Tax=Mycena maculata TaxID=230809 RepID=A0AAD7NL82_9AGAR|nr:hypothetical protein DFH07DRAFT_358766 [Mycena maculata]